MHPIMAIFSFSSMNSLIGFSSVAYHQFVKKVAGILHRDLGKHFAFRYHFFWNPTEFISVWGKISMV